MRVLLFLAAVLAFLLAFLLLFAAKSPINEIQAFILFLISAVCLSGAGIVEAVNSLREELREEQSPPT